MNSQPLLVVIAGPTGIGKTDLAIQLAHHFDTEIISADSRQVYQSLSIGVGRPSESQLSEVLHHCIAHVDLEETYHAGNFEKEALGILERIFNQKNIAIVAGGTGLYIKTLCDGIDEMPEVSEALRNEIEAEFKTQGIGFLQTFVKENDPEIWAVIDQQNPKRLQRAVEIIKASGKKYSSFRTDSKKERPFRILKIALDKAREDLYHSIDLRIDVMLQNGWLDECKQLFNLRHLKALQTVGYKDLMEHLEGAISYEEAVQRVKFHTHQYARRQLTWLRKDKEYHWFHPENRTEIIRLIEQNLLV